MSMEGKPSVVFAHGLWADGSCYSKVIPALIRDGHEVVSTQNSLDSLEGDVAAVKRGSGAGQEPSHPGRSLIWRNRHHSGWNRRPRCRSGLYLRARPGRRRDVAEPAGKVPQNRCLGSHRSSGRPYLVEARGHRVLLWRPVG